MEIQNFFLASRIDHVETTHYVADHPVVVSLNSSPDTLFPVRHVMPALIVLRRQSAAADAPFSLCLNLVDEDGRAAGQPRQLLGQGVIPAGNRYFYLRMDVRFEFPRPGLLRQQAAVGLP
jgi:hypothetical protein